MWHIPARRGRGRNTPVRWKKQAAQLIKTRRGLRASARAARFGQTSAGHGFAFLAVVLFAAPGKAVPQWTGSIDPPLRTMDHGLSLTITLAKTEEAKAHKIKVKT